MNDFAHSIATERLHALRAMPRPALPDRVAELLDVRDWTAAHAAATARDRISVVIEMLLSRPTFHLWPRPLALAIAAGDFPRRDYRRLRTVLELLHGLGEGVVDSDESRQAFADLPIEIDIYRGTSRAEVESGEFGMCWTLTRRTAERFAVRADVARSVVQFMGAQAVARELVPDGFDSSPAILNATVRRADVAGLLTRLGERELLVLPGRVCDVSVTALDRAPSSPAVPSNDAAVRSLPSS